MNIVIFDTETTNLEKPFCYNIGYKVVDTETDQTLIEKDFVVEQVWHNPMLFHTAYYAEKKDFYIKGMRTRNIKMDKFGYICQQMIRDFKAFEIEIAFAYNSPFDTKVFAYNCEWFKCNNPFDNIEIFDIRGYVHKYIAFTKEYQDFCETHEYFTESGNYSTTAETLFRYIKQDIDFVEEHTALADSRIEWEILKFCIDLGANITKPCKTYSSIPREKKQVLTIVCKREDSESVVAFEYDKRRNYKDTNGQVNKIILTNQ